MFSVRRATLRLLCQPSLSFSAKPRTITNLSRARYLPSRSVQAFRCEKRWMTGEAVSKSNESVPVSESEPTSQEEVQDAISQDNAAVEEAVKHVAATESSQGSQSGSEAIKAASVIEPANDTETTGQSTSFLDGAEAVSDGAANASRNNTAAASGREVPKKTVYVGNLFFDVTEDDLVKELARFGIIKTARLVRDPRGLSKGFGYIEFETVEMAQKAVDNLHQQLFEGRRLVVAFAEMDGPHQRRENKPLNPPSRTLFIGNMSFEMTDRDLNNLFKGIRNVVDVRVAIDRRTGQPRGFAHADFVDVKSAMEGLKLLEGKETYGRKLRLDYSYSSSTAPKNTPR